MKNAGTKTLRTKFAPLTRFEVTIPSVPMRGAPEMELDRLKNKLVRQLLKEPSFATLQVPLHKAATEAATLAWMTPYPLLVLPVLLEEKAQNIRLQFERQEQIRRRSMHIYAEAA
jgi:hypothetical protein